MFSKHYLWLILLRQKDHRCFFAKCKNVRNVDQCETHYSKYRLQGYNIYHKQVLQNRRYLNVPHDLYLPCENVLHLATALGTLAEQGADFSKGVV